MQKIKNSFFLPPKTSYFRFHHTYCAFLNFVKEKGKLFKIPDQ